MNKKIIILLASLPASSSFSLRCEELLVPKNESITILLDSKPKKIVASNKSIDFRVRGSKIFILGKKEGETSVLTIILSNRRVTQTIRVVKEGADHPPVHDLRLKREVSDTFQMPTLFYAIAAKKTHCRVVARGEDVKSTVEAVAEINGHLLIRLSLEGDRSVDFSEALIFAGEEQDQPVEVTQKTEKTEKKIIVLLACKSDTSTPLQITLIDMSGEELVNTQLSPRKYV